MDEPLVTVSTFSTPAEAELARNLLQERGIVAFVADAEAVATLWHLSPALGGVKVQVKESELQKARRVLASRPGRGVDDYGLVKRSRRAPAPHREQPRDPDPDEKELESESDATAARAWKAAVIGLIFPVLLLHIYSVWLLLQLPWTGGALSPTGRRKAVAAAALDFLVFVALILFVRSLILPPPPQPWRPVPDF
jgi:hypothetical protein